MSKNIDMVIDERDGKLITIKLSRWRWKTAPNGTEIKLTKSLVKSDPDLYVRIKVRWQHAKNDGSINRNVYSDWSTIWGRNIDVRMIDQQHVAVRMHPRAQYSNY